MLNFTSQQRIFVAKAVVDMRKSFDTLAALVRRDMKADPLSGDVFVFIGRGKNRLKILCWDRSGFWLCAKRLERGTFALPFRQLDKNKSGKVALSPAEIMQLLEGIDVHKATYHAHYANLGAGKNKE